MSRHQKDPSTLPLRWAFILTTAAVIGVWIGNLTDAPETGAGATIAAIALLHKVIRD